MEYPIIENITDDNGNVRTGVWLTVDNVTRLFVEPRGMTNDDAKRMLELDALKAENENLRSVIQDVIDHAPKTEPDHNSNTLWRQAYIFYIAGHVLAEALALVEEKQSCPVCNGAGIISIRNGDDDCTCPACGDKPMSTDELVEEITGK